MKINKQYLKHLWDMHKAKAILMSVLFATFMGVIVIAVGIETAQYKYDTTTVYIFKFFSIMCALAASFIIPLCLYNYLYDRKASDVFLSLPISRQDMFKTSFIYGYGILVIPYTIVYFSVSVILLLMNTLILQDVIYTYLCCIIVAFIIEAINTFVCIKCNNIIDAIIACFAYMLLPLAIILCEVFFVDLSISSMGLGYGYSISELESFNILMLFESILMVVVKMFGNSSEGIGTAVLISNYGYILVYWLIIAGGAIYLAYQSFITKKGEESGAKTTSKFIYPLIIYISAICLCLLIDVYNGLIYFVFMLSFTLIVLAIMLFIANRKIQISKKALISIGIIFIASQGFSFIFRNSDINIVKEIPTYHSNTATMELYLESGEIIIQANNEYEMNILTSMHEDLLSYAQKSKNSEFYSTVVYINYDNAYRSYDLNEVELGKFIEKVIEPNIGKFSNYYGGKLD